MKPFWLSLLFIISTNTWAAPPAFLPANMVYDKAITSPADYLGFNLGERHLTHSQLIAYMRLLASQSERIEVVEYGQTHGHRPLLQLLISSPENLQKAEFIAEANRALMEPGQSKRLKLEAMPLVVNFNYSIHGNEPSGSNAAPAIAYHLAAARGEDIETFLANTVILLDPCLNPDGLDRFANWSNNNVGKNPNPDKNTREHREPWPNGRTNYYWFDLNRDWMLLTQPESQGRLTLYNHWLPGLVLDFHEMGTDQTYFFQPGVPDRTHPLVPDSVQRLTSTISSYFADAMDATGSLFFTRELFDDFYMGKASTIADLKGAIGILFEQASARGIIQDSPSGPVSFSFAIQNQVTISLAVLRAANELRPDLLAHMREFYNESMELADTTPFAGYRFASPGDPARALEFVKVLEGHGIKVQSIKGENAWFIPSRQPQYRYLQALVEKRTEFPLETFYDITAWTLPLAYNLEWNEVEKPPDLGDTKPPPSLLPESRLGYLIDWSHLNAPRLVLDLMQKDIIVNVAKKPFTCQERSFGYGTIFVPVTLQKDKASLIHQILQAGTQSLSVDVVGVDSFLTEDGVDLGSPSIVRIQSPHILLVTGRGVGTYTAGAVWHLVDVLHDYPVTLVEHHRMAGMDLTPYSAIILPGASKGTYSGKMGEQLSKWVNKGGTLVCLDNATEWIIEQELTTLSLLPMETNEANPRRPFAEARSDKAIEKLEGAIFLGEADPSHPLAYGYANGRIPLFVEGENILHPSPNPYQTPIVFQENPLLSGYASEQNLTRLTGAAADAVDPQGKGAIVLFGHNPVFRAYWRGTEKFLLNAILFGQLMKED